MKKIWALIIIMVFCCSLFPGVAAFDAVAPDAPYSSRKIQILIELGIIDSAGFAAENYVTRGEFAEVLVRLGNYGTFTGVRADFFDVTEQTPSWEEISIAASMGLVAGDGNGNFRPNDFVSYNEACKSLVELLGYGIIAENTGGYPLGYLYAASGIGLLRGASAPANGIITAGVLSTVLYNSLSADLYRTVSVSAESARYSVEKDVNILSEYHGHCRRRR